MWLACWRVALHAGVLSRFSNLDLRTALMASTMCKQPHHGPYGLDLKTRAKKDHFVTGGTLSDEWDGVDRTCL